MYPIYTDNTVLAITHIPTEFQKFVCGYDIAKRHPHQMRLRNTFYGHKLATVIDELPVINMQFGQAQAFIDMGPRRRNVGIFSDNSALFSEASLNSVLAEFRNHVDDAPEWNIYRDIITPIWRVIGSLTSNNYNDLQRNLRQSILMFESHTFVCRYPLLSSRGFKLRDSFKALAVGIAANPLLPESLMLGFQYNTSLKNRVQSFEDKFVEEIKDGLTYGPNTFSNVYARTNKQVEYVKLPLTSHCLRDIKNIF